MPTGGLNSHSRLQQMQQSKLIGANEDMFLKAFDSTPKLNLATQKKLENELQRVVTIISNPSADWDQRVQAMKHFRSIINSGITDTYDDFYTTTLKTLEIPFQNNICDLRSQVVRETCITIAFLSCRLQQKFSRMAEILLPSLIKLIPNSAKIMSTSALVALRFIIQSTHHHKLITIIKYQLSTSKAKDIHRALCEIVERIATLWPPNVIEKQLGDFQEVLRLGICDSDEMARQNARRAFKTFAEHFREPAERLYNSLDPQRQRMLNNLSHGGGSTLSMNEFGSITSGLHTIGLSSAASSSSNHHFNQALSSAHGPSSLAHSNYNSHHSTNHHMVPRLKSSLAANNGLPGHTFAPPSTNNAAASSKIACPSRIRTPTARSTSAIDVAAQQRARARAVYLNSMYQRPRQLNNMTPSPITRVNNHQYPSHFGAANSTPLSQKMHVTAVAAAAPVSVNQNMPPSTSGAVNNAEVCTNNQQTTPSGIPTKTSPPQPNVALSKAASYLMSVINDEGIAESQVVATIKYFNSLIEKHSSELIRQLLSELMPPLVIGVDNSAISVRKASVFAMVAIYAKVGLPDLEPYLTSLTMTQRKLLEVYMKKFTECPRE